MQTEHCHAGAGAGAGAGAEAGAAGPPCARVGDNHAVCGKCNLYSRRSRWNINVAPQLFAVRLVKQMGVKPENLVVTPTPPLI